MSILSTVKQGVVAQRPLRCLVYGLPGIGKSTFAAGAPDALYLDAEHGTLGLDVARVEIARWADFSAALRELKGEHPYRTVVVDTVDALERMLVESVCEDAHSSSIDKVGGGYGRGWTRVEARWCRVLDELAELQHRRRLNVILLAHCTASTFNDPAGEDYTRWSLRLNKKIKEQTVGWVDEQLFATYSVQTEKGSRKAKKDGRRVLRTEWRPGADAKNRRDLPFEIPLSWDAFRGHLAKHVKAHAPGEVDRAKRQQEIDSERLAEVKARQKADEDHESEAFEFPVEDVA